MPTGLSEAELGYLRSHPHRSRMYLSVVKPQMVYQGQMGGSSHGDRIITVSDIAGDKDDVEKGMTIIVSTDAAGDDIVFDGRRRFREWMATWVMKMDEHNIDWEDGWYVTVYRTWELWPVFPYITLEKPFLYYRDRDIVYVDQNDKVAPVPIIKGNHFVGFLDGGSVTFTLDAGSSYWMADGAAVSSHVWECDGGSIADPNLMYTTITFTVPNKNGYWLKLTITDTNGVSKTTHRVIFVHTRTGEHAPHADFGFTNPITGSWGEGGWKCSVEVRDDADIDNFPDKSLCIVWSEEYYDDTKREIWPDSNIEMIGYVRGSTIKKSTTGDDSVKFGITTVESLLKAYRMHSISLTDVASPTDWNSYSAGGYGLSLQGAVHHLWNHCSTLINITNVQLQTGGRIRIHHADDFVSGNLYDMAEKFAYDHGIFAHVCCTKRGEVHLAEDIRMRPDSERESWPVMMEIIEEDMRGDPIYSIVKDSERKASFGTASGMSYDGVDDTSIISIGPAFAPFVGGSKVLNLERLMLEDQADANSRIGRALALINNPYKLFPIKFAGNYSFIDLVFQRWYEITIAEEDTKRGLVLTDYKLIPRTIVNSYDPSSGAMMTDVTFETDVEGQDGTPGSYPDEVPPPPPPKPDPDPLPEPEGDGFGTLYVMTMNHLHRTREFSASSPTYINIMDGVSTSLFDFILDPWDPAGSGYCLTLHAVYKSTDLFMPSPTWTKVLNFYDVENYWKAEGSGNRDKIDAGTMRGWKIIASINVEGYVGFVYSIQMDCGIGSKCRNIFYSYSLDGGNAWNHSADNFPNVGPSLGNACKFYGTLDYVPHSSDGKVTLYLGVGHQDCYPQYASDGNYLYKSVDSGATWTLQKKLKQSPDPGFGNPCGYGMYMLTCPYQGNEAGTLLYFSYRYNTPAGTLYTAKSTDSGVTWTTFVPVSGAEALACRIGMETWTHNRDVIFFWNDGNDSLYVTENGGGSWDLKSATGVTADEICAAGGFPTQWQQYYVVTNNGVFVSTDGGDTFLDRTGDIPMTGAQITGLTVSGDEGRRSRCVIVPNWLPE